jgi:hypothetical protein
VVGYDDEFGPYLENGNPDTYGAFKVVNSWGTGFWENVPDGFYFISYACFLKRFGHVYLYEDRQDYQPNLLSVFEIEHNKRDECRLSVGLGDTSAPVIIKKFNENYSRGGSFPFPANKMVMDITEMTDWMSGPPDTFFLDVYNFSMESGTIVNFSIEEYDHYSSGVPVDVVYSNEVPKTFSADSKSYVSVGFNASTISVFPSNIFTGWRGADSLIAINCNGDVNMPWSVIVTQGTEWLLLLSDNTGNGDADIDLRILQNDSGVTRTGILEIDCPSAINSPREVRITQSPMLEFTILENGDIINDTGASVGCSWGDSDGDGELSLYITNRDAGKNYLYHYDPYAMAFKYQTLTGFYDFDGITTDTDNSYASAWVDFDNDGDDDLFVCNKENDNSMYINDKGHFHKMESDPIVSDGGRSLACAWSDYNLDGYLDLFVANDGENNFLYTGNGNGTFTKISEGAIVTDGGPSTACSWADYDGDSDPDLFVCNYRTGNFLYRNNGDGTFNRVLSGVVVEDVGASFGASWGDFNADGLFDLFVANDGEKNCLYAGSGGGSFRKILDDPVVNYASASFGSAWADIDNDGDLDLFVSNHNEKNDLFLNDATGVFEPVTEGSIVKTISPSYSCAFADYDHDGDPDLCITNSDTTTMLYRNDTDNDHHWLEVRCVGNVSNRDGIGAKVTICVQSNGVMTHQVREITAQTGGGYGGQSPKTACFGIGSATVIDSLTISWPSGIQQTLTDIDPDRYLTVTETDIFEKVTKGDIVNDVLNTYACCWGDYNNDGYPDLFLANPGPNSLYRNKGDGTFVQIAEGDIVTDDQRSHGAAWGDFDNDGDLDLVVANSGINKVYRNDGNGNFEDATEGELIADEATSYSGSWGDYNNDGYLDIFIANGGKPCWLYQNNGSGLFFKDPDAGIRPDHKFESTEFSGSCWADYDNDHDLDLIVLNYYSNYLYTNQGDGTFSQSFLYGGSTGASWGDCDNDRDLDLFFTAYEWDPSNRLYINNNTLFEPPAAASVEYASDTGGQGSSWADYDNDGDLDLFVTRRDWTYANPLVGNLLYENQGDGTFKKVDNSILTVEKSYTGSGAWADIDLDGDLDLFVTSVESENALYINNTEPQNWLGLNCVGMVSNRSAVGAHVFAKADIYDKPTWQMRECSAQTGRGSQNDLRIHFGFGDATEVDSLVVSWPSGLTDTYTNLAVNRFLTIIEGQGVVPVELASFTAENKDGRIVLTWQTNSERNCYGYALERKSGTSDYKQIAFIAGSGTSNEPVLYSFVDDSLRAPGRYVYRLKQIDLNGAYHYSMAVLVEVTGPLDFVLYPNYPNPFNPQTTIRYSLPARSEVRLEIFNIIGQRIRTLVDASKNTGYYKEIWDGRDDAGIEVPTGIYVIRLQAGKFSDAGKMLLLK